MPEERNMLPEGAKPLEMGSTFVKWAQVGQSVQGKILRMELSKKYTAKDGGGNYVLQIRQPDRKVVAVSAPLLLKQCVENNDLIGRTVAIVFTGTTKTPNGEQKNFQVGLLPDMEDDDTPF